MTEHEKQVEKLVDALGCSIAEAEQLMLDDKAVDKMTVAQCKSDMTAEHKAVAKKSTQVARAKKPFIPDLKTPSNRPKDATKVDIVNRLYEFLTANLAESAEIVNEGKLIHFTVGGKQYKLDLIATRTPKK